MAKTNHDEQFEALRDGVELAEQRLDALAELMGLAAGNELVQNISTIIAMEAANLQQLWRAACPGEGGAR